MRIKNRFKCLLFFALAQTYISFGQPQLPIYSDYLTDNYFLVHPATAGAQLEASKCG